MKIVYRFAELVLLLACLAAWVAMSWPVALALALLGSAWLLLARSGGLTRAVVATGLSTLHRRMGASLVVVVGIAGVVGVLVALLSMAQGYGETMRRSGNASTAIVTRGGSASEVTSVLDRQSVTLIAQAPGIRRDARGEPLVSAELVVGALLPLKSRPANREGGGVQIRGVGDQAWSVRPLVHVVAGRRFQPGLHELVVGQGAARQYAGLEPGREVRLGNQAWTVVGVFASGDAMESEVWADAAQLADTYRRGASRSSVVAQLIDEHAFNDFKSALQADPQLRVDISTTLDYFTRQSAGLTTVIRVVGMVVGIIMAGGAIASALNTMFSVVTSRAREIATLRAIGFSGVPVVAAVMLETMLLALAGGIVGGFVAWLAFDGYSASTRVTGTVGLQNFQLHVDPTLLWTGLKWALAVGFVGGLFPALRAARLPIATALREVH